MIDRGALSRQDMHVHSTFSDGVNTVEENVEEAERLGLVELGCVDHVRHDTDWVADFSREVARVRRLTHVRLTCAVEVKVLDTSGRLDLPDRLPGVDRIYVADHQVPTIDGPRAPHDIRDLIEEGTLDAADVVAQLVASLKAAVEQSPSTVIAHLFSVLPKLGLSEDDVPEALVDALSESAASSGALLEIDERWRCPSAGTAARFIRRGVPVLLSTDSHRRETIGRYAYCASVVEQLEDGGVIAQGRS